MVDPRPGKGRVPHLPQIPQGGLRILQPQRGPRPPETADPPEAARPAVPKKPKPKESDGRAGYYIVEKKRRPPKASYAKPKKIRFEEDGAPDGR